MERVLITGAAGRIGQALRKGLKGSYPILRITDIASLGDTEPHEEAIQADLANLDEMHGVMREVDAVVHLGGTVGEAPWETILQNNIIGHYNTFEAARHAGIRRIVYASSIHTQGFYRRDRTISAEDPVRPDSRYGVSKVFGEGLGRMYADKFDMEVVCLRIASFRPEPTKLRELGTWISPRDIAQLVRCSLEKPDVHFEILYGVSGNDAKLYDDPKAAQLGYRPEDNSKAYEAELRKHQSEADEPALERTFHGAHIVSPEFAGDLSKIT